MIHEDDVEGVFSEAFKRVRPAHGLDDGNLVRFQDSFRHVKIHLVIVDDERPRLWCAECRLERGSCLFQRRHRRVAELLPAFHSADNVEMECRALAVFAFDADRAAHHLDELTADGETEPRAFDGPVAFCIDLGEAGKNGFKVFRLDADASVAD